MRRIVAGLVALALIGVVAVAVGLSVTAPPVPRGPVAQTHASSQEFSDIERGRYLTIVADCAACHTDPHSGQPFAGGRAIETPFGTVAAPNITPDPETGIGTWTDTDFSDALRRGFGKDGHMLYPAMPFVYYAKATPEDIVAIRAYLRTVAPVHNKVVANQLPFPFNIRLGMRAWDLLYFKPDGFKPDPSRSAEWNRGAYLVEGLAHCGACHTPKTLIGGDETSGSYHGFRIQGWFAPDISGDERRGIGTWSPDDIVEYLQTGHNKQAAASGPMAEEVSDSSSAMSIGDLKAIAVYLKSLPTQGDSGAPVPADDPMMRAGEAIYVDSCAACHKAGGDGQKGLFPTLKRSPTVEQRDPTSLLRVVLDGAKSVATDRAPTGAAMPSYGWQLRDDQVAAVLTYVRNAWGNAAPAVPASAVASMRHELVARPN